MIDAGRSMAGIWVGLALLVGAVAARAGQPTARELMAQGNEKFSAKEFGPAQELYRQAATVNPGLAGAVFNEGCALLEQEKYGEAAERFREADRVSTTAEVSKRARFNLGQALLREAKASMEKPEQAMQSLAASADAFASCLEIDPKDNDAARATEIVRRMIKGIQDQQKQQQQQQDKDGEKNKDQQSPSDGKQNKDQNKDKGKDQQGKQDQGQQKDGQQGDESQKLSDLAKKQAEEAKKNEQAGKEQQSQQREEQQKKLSEQTKQAKEERQKEKQKGDANGEKADRSDKVDEKLSQAQQEQKAAQESLEKKDAKKAAEHQQKAAELLNEAAQQAAQEQRDQKQAKDEKPKYDEGAAQLLEREKEQRERRERILRALRGKPQPVEKDW